jgi:hypothetical protein
VSPEFVQVTRLKAIELEEQMALQLTLSSSRSKINYGIWAHMEVDALKEHRYFDVSNVDDYDVILGTLFMWMNGISLIFEDGGWVMWKSTCMELPPGTRVVKIKQHHGD